ncbi:glycoside hydrolase family 2 protein [Lentithecium fluviatile CBS 122367]|uniref:Glycoside hydrolase family 2 protein n=1 Tax=Lentithecium fluviatile CBS 122367 TaxID=1168545 RepID=A0A6G1JE26_9PLEO|nr:glycoside hydrolase family 2 protein [Lentithecium fluviatile CBS 122367]
MASKWERVAFFGLLLLGAFHSTIASALPNITTSGRQRISLNNEWRFRRTEKNVDNLLYDYRSDNSNLNTTGAEVLKPYILPSANDFITDPAARHTRPDGGPRSNVSFTGEGFDDSKWESVTLPHDWAIKGPFYVGDSVPVTGGMGRLPVQGVGWYRRKLDVSSSDRGKILYLDIDGAQSYAMVWLNGHLVGGWPYGYASFRLNLTPYVKFQGENILAIRVDNPTDSSRWYPGGGIYRNVWLTKVEPIHVSQWGTYVVTDEATLESAKMRMVVQIVNKANSTGTVEVATDIHLLDPESGRAGAKVAQFLRFTRNLTAGSSEATTQAAVIQKPLLWGPWTTQKPNMYVAITRLSSNNKVIDTYDTHFGIRTFTYNGDKGLLVNGAPVRIQGVNQHHDLGAIGAAFNLRAAQRQLEILRDLGCNAIRMSHNPPAPELLELTDRMGFLVTDEIFDSWQRNKTKNDFHLIFDDWHEPDLRAFIRRDRNHPSIFAWSIGNEVGEQYTNETGAAVAQMLREIAHEEDPTRPVTASMNYAKPYMPFPQALDILNVNYQGEGIRNAPAYSHLTGIVTPPQYKAFHDTFPEKLLLSSETAAALSTRGTYIFPVVNGTSAPVNNTSGGNSTSRLVSAYELYSADFGSSPDKVFAAQDQNPFVAGEFVWSGFDYIGEPTPYYAARSSYFGIVDLAGFPKDRYYLYQSRWRPEVKLAHILPHWTWPERVGLVTPVHVFSSGDEAELFLNGKSLGRQKKDEYEYRFRWDDVVYQPGELHVATYKDDQPWAEATTQTAGPATRLRITTDRKSIAADGKDLAFAKVEVLDKEGVVVPGADNEVTFEVEGRGQLVATDNGDPRDFTPFPSRTRKAFSGLALGIFRSEEGGRGGLKIKATAEGLEGGEVVVQVE